MSSIGRVPERTIQDILARIDLAELIGEDVQLKKAGANFSGLCPFHQEKTPSFTVSPTKQFYHCFGCGAHGDAIAYLMEREGLPFIEALSRLAESVGVSLPKREDSAEPSEPVKPLYTLLKQAAIFYHQQWKTAQARPAIAYLKKRGLDKTIVNRFAIGFAPPGWENLRSHFNQNGVDDSLLEKVGLVTPSKKSGVYDRFRHRIVFPIRDIKGRVLGFGGRVLDDSLPKYLNSPETLLFHKSECLYGLYESRAFRSQKVLLVEGYMDVVALAQYGVTALACLGTAIGEGHFKHLFRYYHHVVLCFDGDEAGKKAAWKACTQALSVKNDARQIDFVFLPQGHDPDSYIRAHGLKAFEGLVEQAMPYSEYFFKHLQEEIPPTSLDNRARLVKMAQPLLQKLPQGVFKGMMMDKLHEIQGTKKPGRRVQRVRRGQSLRRGLKPAQWVAVLLLKYPEWLNIIHEPKRLLTIETSGIDMLTEVIRQIEENLGTFSGEFYELFKEKHPQWREPLSVEPWHLLNAEALEEAFLGAVQRLEAVLMRGERKKLLEKAKLGELSEEEKQLLKEFYAVRN